MTTNDGRVDPIQYDLPLRSHPTMPLTRTQAADSLFDRLGLNKSEARELVNLFFFEEICIALCRGEPVCLPRFGSFNLRNKNPRPGRNPSTGKAVAIRARRVVVTFKPAIRLRVRTAAHVEAENLGLSL